MKEALQKNRIWIVLCILLLCVTGGSVYHSYTIGQQVAGLQTELENYKDSYEKSEDQLKEYQQDVAEQKKTIEKLQSERDEQQAKIDEQQTTIDDLQKKNQQLTAAQSAASSAGAAASSASTSSTGETGGTAAAQETSAEYYYTRTGECYHTRAHGNGTFYPCTLAEAKNMGLRACHVCCG